jgi:CheY-like chemotaxis protein
MVKQSKKREKTYEILMIEDNPADSRLIVDAWQQCHFVKANTSVLGDSRAAIPYLRNSMEFENANNVRPDLILLDYKMPTNGGIALTEIKGDPDYMDIPVIVITGSHDPEDIRQIYLRNANCCFSKPMELEGIHDLVCDIARHWLLRAVLPPQPLEC